jgi:hypothetical protein
VSGESRRESNEMTKSKGQDYLKRSRVRIHRYTISQLERFRWRSGSTIGFWATLICSATSLASAILFTVTYSKGSFLAQSCRLLNRSACVEMGRTTSVVLYLLSACFSLGAVKIHELAREVRNEGESSRFTSSLLTAATKINPTATRFSLGLSLLGAPAMAIVLGWSLLGDSAEFKAMPFWIRVAYGVAMGFVATWLVVELIENFRSFKLEIGNWKRGLATVGTIYLFLLTRKWTGWSCGDLAVIAAVIAGAVAFWQWLIPSSRVHDSK